MFNLANVITLITDDWSKLPFLFSFVLALLFYNEFYSLFCGFLFFSIFLSFRILIAYFFDIERRSTLEDYEIATKKLVDYIDKYVVQQKLPKYRLSEELRNLMKESNNDQ